MKTAFKKFCILLMVFSFGMAQATDFEARALAASRTAYGYMGADRFSDFIRDSKVQLHKEDKQYFESVVSHIKAWPAMISHNDEIIIGDGKFKVTIKILDLKEKKFSINGRVLVLNTNQSVVSQLRQLFPKTAKHALLEKINSVGEWIFPQAHAVNPLITSGIASVASGNPEAGTAMITMGTAIETLKVGGAAAAGGGLLASIAALPAAVIAAIIAATAVVAYGSYCAIEGNGASSRWEKNRSFGNEFANCLMSPLSWIDKNPRDNLYISDFRCPNEGGKTIYFRLKSLSHLDQEFRYIMDSQNNLKEVYLNGKENLDIKFGNNQKAISAERRNGIDRNEIIKSPEELKKLSLVAQHFQYLKDFCADSKRVDALKKEIESGKSLELKDVQGVK